MIIFGSLGSWEKKTSNLQLQIEKNTGTRHYYTHSLGEHHFNIYDFWHRHQDKMKLKKWWEGTRGMYNRTYLLSLPTSPSQWTQLKTTGRLVPLILVLKIILQYRWKTRLWRGAPAHVSRVQLFFSALLKVKGMFDQTSSVCLPIISFGALFITNRYNKDTELPVSKYRMEPALKTER